MNKLVLVPEAMYKGLLSSGEYADRTNVEYAKEKLESVKKNKKLNASAKNTLYNQELRRYLVMRNVEKNKPLKVSVEGGAKFLTKPLDKGSQALAIDDNGGMEVVEEAQKDAPFQSQYSPAKNDDLKDLSSEVHGHGHLALLYNYIKTKAYDFGVTENNQVLTRKNGSNVVEGSDLKEIVTAIISKKNSNVPGLSLIKNRGAKDEGYRLILNRKDTHRSPRRTARKVGLQPIHSTNFKPELWGLKK